MKQYLLSICMLGLAFVGWGQMDKKKLEKPANRPVKYAETITAEELKELLYAVASDEFEGRETGTEGQRKAADFIAGKLEEMGLLTIGENDTYFQKIAYTGESWKEISLQIDDDTYRHLWDFYAFATRNSNRPNAVLEEITFLGYGIDDEQYSDYRTANVAGKSILIYAGEPMDKDGNFRISGSTEPSEWSTNFRKKLMAAKAKGVENVFIIDPQIKKNVGENRRFILSSRMRIGEGENPEENFANNVYISSTVARDMIGRKFNKVVRSRDKIKKKGKLKPVKIKTDIILEQEKNVRQLIGSNVMGFIEGLDPELKDEIVVISAHYDHLGKRGESIFNGADDNGSGTSTVMEVCEAFVQAKAAGVGPRRSILVIWVSGEEKGLLGSQYYVNNPIFKLENTVVDINVDMVGRVDEKYKDNPNYIYVIGSDRLSTELHEINETANKTYTNLVLDYTYNADDDPNRYYYRSDHYNFAEKGIPAIFYFNGVHEDYHRPSDTPDKINYEKMAKIGQLIFYTAWEIANRDKRIEVDVVGRN